MEMIPVVSSLLKAVGYDPEAQELSVEFKKGDTYVYRGVTQAVFHAMMEAQSIGHFFLRNIKSNYECTKESNGPPRQA